MNYSERARFLDNVTKIFFILACIGSGFLMLRSLGDLEEDWMYLVSGLSIFLGSLIIMATLRVLAGICEAAWRILIHIEEKQSSSDSSATDHDGTDPNSLPD